MDENSKPWWTSKMLRVNGVATIVAILAAFGFDVSPEVQAAALALLGWAVTNFAMRLVTKKALTM